MLLVKLSKHTLMYNFLPCSLWFLSVQDNILSLLNYILLPSFSLSCLHFRLILLKGKSVGCSYLHTAHIQSQYEHLLYFWYNPKSYYHCAAPKIWALLHDVVALPSLFLCKLSQCSSDTAYVPGWGLHSCLGFPHILSSLIMQTASPSFFASLFKCHFVKDSLPHCFIENRIFKVSCLGLYHFLFSFLCFSSNFFLTLDILTIWCWICIFLSSEYSYYNASSGFRFYTFCPTLWNNSLSRKTLMKYL